MKRVFFIGIVMLFLAQSIAGIGSDKSLKMEIFEDELYAFPGWNRKQAITIQASQVSGASTLTDFPVLITLDHLNDEVVDGGVNSALNGGGDIRFSSDAAGNNQLAIEVVEFVTSATPANRRCQIWVQVPSLSATANTTIYIWYNKSGELQPTASSTYGSQAVWSEYKAVWHMETNPSGTILDVTGNGHDLTSSGSMQSANIVEGKLGSAIQFDGVDDEMSLGSPVSYNSTFTFSVWFNWDQASAGGSYSGILSNQSPYDGFWATTDGGSRMVFYDGNQEFSSPNSIVANTTTRYDFVANSGDVNHFINSVADTGTLQALDTGAFTHMGSEGGAAYFSGWIDEIRVGNMARSQDWLITEYNNQGTPSSFAIAGSPTSTSGGGDTQDPTAPTLSSTGKTDATTNLSWSGATDNIGVTGYKVYKGGALEATLGNVGTYQVTGLTASTTYSFTVTALDAAGNESTASNSVSVTTDATSGGGSSVWTESGSVASYSGDVAIGGVSVPTGYKLAVDGKLIVEEIKVQPSGSWPDYVFAKDYDLPTLEEVKKHIEEKGHLPNIPSAEEVKANGVELGEMNRLLLEKVEEMILYIIEQEQKLNDMQEKVKALNVRLDKTLGND